MRQSRLYKRLRDAVEAQGSDRGRVEGLSAAEVRSLIGADARGMTTTMVNNATAVLAAESRRREMQATADWIISLVQRRFADVEVKIRRRGLIEVWLEGKPAEVEL